jgi:hypothetical protein
LARSALQAPRHRHDADIDWLALLPEELPLCVFSHLRDYSDCVSVSIASPRLGLKALQNGLLLPRFQHPLFAVAMQRLMMEMGEITRRADPARHAGGREGLRPSTVAQRVEGRARQMATPGSTDWSFTETWLRKFAAEGLCTFASSDDLVWIKARSPTLFIVQDDRSRELNLVRNRVVDACLAEMDDDGTTLHYEGEMDAEHLVRIQRVDGTVEHYEGERGCERLVRGVMPNGDLHYLEGEMDAEQLVRVQYADRTVEHFEGERGNERHVRSVMPNGDLHYLEGEMDAEHLVRVQRVDGTVEHYEGEREGERLVRLDDV